MSTKHTPGEEIARHTNTSYCQQLQATIDRQAKQIGQLREALDRYDDAFGMFESAWSSNLSHPMAILRDANNNARNALAENEVRNEH